MLTIALIVGDAERRAVGIDRPPRNVTRQAISSYLVSRKVCAFDPMNRDRTSDPTACVHISPENCGALDPAQAFADMNGCGNTLVPIFTLVEATSANVLCISLNT